MADVVELFGPQSYWVKNVEAWVKLPGHSQYLPVGAIKKGAGSVSVSGMTFDVVDVFVEGRWNFVKRVKGAESGVTIKLDLAETTAFTIPIVQGHDPTDDLTWTSGTRKAKISVGGNNTIPQLALKLVANDAAGTNVANIYFHICENMNGADWNPSMGEPMSFVWELQARPDYENNSGEVYYWELIIDSEDITTFTATSGGYTTAATTATTVVTTDDIFNYRFVTLTTTGGTATTNLIPVGQTRIIYDCTATNSMFAVSEPWCNSTGTASVSAAAGDTFEIWVPAVRIQEDIDTGCT